MATTRPRLFGLFQHSGEMIISNAAPLTGDKIRKIAGRGLSEPELVTHAEIQELCGSVLRHIREQH